MNEAWLLWGVLFGGIGLGMLVYGKKQGRTVPFICGIGLMAAPYFVSSTIALVLIGGLLLAACYVIRV